jgi:DNA-binding MarR family transcriptional regulator
MPNTKGVALGTLFEEAVALYHQLTSDAALIHGLGSMSGPRRTVLVALARSGPQTVAHLARARAQSRQRFQPLVNGLLTDGFVETRPNPMHTRSPLIGLTAKGGRAVKRIVSTEAALRERVKVASSPRSLSRAAAVVREVRLALKDQVPQMVRAGRRVSGTNRPL